MAVLPIIAVAAVAFLLSLVLVPLVIRISHRFGFLDPPGKHKRHRKPTPILGGIALFLAVWITIFAVVGFHGGEYEPPLQQVLMILLGAVIIVATGFVDDLRPLSAWVKLAAQILAGLMLYFAGLNPVLLTTPYGSVFIGPISPFITIIWVVVLTNAINLIDGLDGLAGGVSLIAALTMTVIAILFEVGWIMVFAATMIGFLPVFLRYNRYPARLFLGDSGSMQIGYYFAVFSLAVPLKSYTASALFLPLVALGVPVLETLTSFARRLVSGRNIMQADRRHLFHYLALIGFSRRKVVLIFYILGAVFGGFALAMFFWNRLVVLGVLVVFMVVIFGLFFILVTGLSVRKRTASSGVPKKGTADGE